MEGALVKGCGGGRGGDVVETVVVCCFSFACLAMVVVM